MNYCELYHVEFMGGFTITIDDHLDPKPCPRLNYMRHCEAYRD